MYITLIDLSLFLHLFLDLLFFKKISLMVTIHVQLVTEVALLFLLKS